MDEQKALPAGNSSARGKTGPKFTDYQRLLIEEIAWKAHCLKRMSQHEIAQLLLTDYGIIVDRSTISRSLKRAAGRVIDANKKRIEDMKAAQTTTLEHIARESLEAWEASKAHRKKVSQKREELAGAATQGSELSGLTTTTTVEEEIGDTAYLREARGALKDIRDIWGVGRSDSGDAVDGKLVVEVRRAPPAPFPVNPADKKPDSAQLSQIAEIIED